jgi:peptidoglycan/LPS O-acetylase OafA/YrhL
MRNRIAGLDGLRGLAALYVAAHHCWLLSFAGYPRNTGPAWTGWLLHGRLAVVFFITLSGFSLAVGPASDSWRLGGLRRYVTRRARRILPAYWAALAVSLVVAQIAAPLPLSHPPSDRSVFVYGLLLQDFISAPAPNGAFWSIAVETGLYICFPLLLLIRRRAGAAVLLAMVCIPAIAANSAGPFTLQLAPLFAMGLVAAGHQGHGPRDHRRPSPWMAVIAATPVLVVIAWKGSEWTVHHYFWIDLAIGPAIAVFLAAVATGHPIVLLRVLTAWPIRRLGQCSYSLYLLHMPIVALVSRRLVAPHVPPGLPTFNVTLLVAIPASIATAAAFASVVELPFQRTGKAMDSISGAAEREAAEPAMPNSKSSPARVNSKATLCSNGGADITSPEQPPRTPIW